jgi:hypothetical protein
MERIRTHLSYANVAATLALVFAMSGGAIAATGGFTAASNSIKACVGSNGVLKLQTGKKCKHGQKAVTWNQKGPAGAKGATGPSGIAGLNGAAVPNATNAVTAATANNALALGGIPASGFTQRSCGSDTGQVKGFSQIPGSISSTFAPVEPSYNCSGGAVEADRIAEGRYRFRFVGNPAEIALTTVISPLLAGDWTSQVIRLNTVEWEVSVKLAGKPSDEGVSIVLF